MSANLVLDQLGEALERLELAREVVTAKIANSAAVLRRFRTNHPERVSMEEISKLDGFAEAVQRAGSISSLLGAEGSAAAHYFPRMVRTVPEPLRPASRERRPPPDPFNALLSFGYVLVGNELQSLLDAMGFDPYVGFFHEVDYGRPSLALDLLEEFRPALVDRFSATLLNLEQLKAEDFETTAQGGVRLKRDGMKTYFAAYEKELTQTQQLEDGEAQTSFRESFRRQAERLAKAIRGEEPYRALRLSC